MNSTTDSGSSAPEFESGQRVHISALSRDVDGHVSAHIQARISLVWPYSSSSQQYAFLLSETDARPLKSGQQIKVVLHDGAARAVQSARVGIGDTIKLSLRGAEQIEVQDYSLTPGKRYGRDLSFRNAVTLEATRAADGTVEIIQYSAPETNGMHRTNGTTNGYSVPKSPIIVGFEGSAPVESSPKLPFKSPALRKTSGPTALLYTTDDPFAEDIERDAGRSRKRTKFARPSGAWRLLNDDVDEVYPSSPSMSPTKRQPQQVPETSVDTQASPMSGVETSLSVLPSEDVVTAVNENSEPSTAPIRISEPEELPTRSLEKPMHPSGSGIMTDDDAIADSEGIELERPSVELSANQPSIQGEEVTLSRERDRDLDMHDPSVPTQQAEHGQEATDMPSAPIEDFYAEHAEIHESQPTMDSLPQHSQPMGPPMTPARPKMQLDISSSAEDDTEARATTPRLLPLASPGLPLVSPLIKRTGVETGYFPTISSGLSELDNEFQAPAAQLTPDPSDVREFHDVPNASSPALLQSGNEHNVSDVSGVSPTQMIPAIPTAVAGFDAALPIDLTEPLEVSTRPHLPTGSAQPTPDPLLKSADALAFLEEFLQMSPVNEQQPVPIIPDLTQAERSPRLVGEIESSPQPDVVPQLQDAPAHRSPDDKNEPEVRIDVARVSPHSIDGSADVVDSVISVGRGFEKAPSLTSIASGREQTPQTFDSAVGPSEDSEVITVIAAGLAEAAPVSAQVSYLPTPAATQQMDSLQDVPREPFPEKSETLPAMPQTSQASAEIPAAQVVGLETTSVAELEEKVAQPMPATPATAKRTSERLTRKLQAPISIDSALASDNEPAAADDISSHSLRATHITEELAEKRVVLPRKAGIRTSLGYYPSLSSLQSYYGQMVDIIAVCSTDSTKAAQAKNGPRDWHTTLTLTDTSESIVSAQIFRPYRSAIPRATQGEVVILRNFKVQTMKHQWMLLSTDESSWAVFRNGTDNAQPQARMTGPELEYGQEETANVQELMGWWMDNNSVENGSHEEQSARKASPKNVSEEAPSILPTIEEAGPSSPRRSRRLQSEPKETQGQDEAAVTLGDDPVHLQPTRRQPSRRARTKTPTLVPQQHAQPEPTTKARRTTPSIAISETSPSISAASPPVSPTSTRRRTRSTLSPNPSVASIAETASTSGPTLTSPIASTFPGTLTRPTGRGRGRPTKGRKADDADTVMTQSTSEQPQHQTSPKRTTRSMRGSMRAGTASPPLVHELRDGMRYVDLAAEVAESVEEDGDDEQQDGGAAVKGKGKGKQKERDGVVTDERRRRGLRSEDVHELRDGNRWVD